MQLIALLFLAGPLLAADFDVTLARKLLSVRSGDQVLMPATQVKSDDGGNCELPASTLKVVTATPDTITFRNPDPGAACLSSKTVSFSLAKAKEMVANADERIVMWDSRNDRELAFTSIAKEHRATSKCPYDPGVHYRFTEKISSAGFSGSGQKKECTASKGDAVKMIGCTSTGRAVAVFEKGKGDCAAGDVLVGKLPLEARFPLTDKIKSFFRGSDEENDSAPAE